MSDEFGKQEVLKLLNIDTDNSGVSTGTNWIDAQGEVTSSFSPIDGKEIGKVKNATMEDYEMVIKKAQEAFLVWRKVPAPVRGEAR